MLTTNHFQGVLSQYLGVTSFNNALELLIIRISPRTFFLDRKSIIGGSMFCHIRFKACQKCGGDLSLEQDKYGSYFECIQCGAVWNARDLRTPDIRVAVPNPLSGVSAPAAVK